MSDGCPLGDKLFDELAASMLGGTHEDTDGVLKATVELFIEQFSASTLTHELVGIGRLTRDTLEGVLSSDTLSEELAEVVAATIDCARELSAQAYAQVSGFTLDYVVPWLERIRAWLDAYHGDCPCNDSVKTCLEQM